MVKYILAEQTSVQQKKINQEACCSIWRLDLKPPEAAEPVKIIETAFGIHLMVMLTNVVLLRFFVCVFLRFLRFWVARVFENTRFFST